MGTYEGGIEKLDDINTIRKYHVREARAVSRHDNLRIIEELDLFPDRHRSQLIRLKAEGGQHPNEFLFV